MIESFVQVIINYCTYEEIEVFAVQSTLMNMGNFI